LPLFKENHSRKKPTKNRNKIQPVFFLYFIISLNPLFCLFEQCAFNKKGHKPRISIFCRKFWTENHIDIHYKIFFFTKTQSLLNFVCSFALRLFLANIKKRTEHKAKWIEHWYDQIFTIFKRNIYLQAKNY